MEQFKTSSDVLFVLLGAIMVLAMHAGFAFHDFAGADLSIHKITSTPDLKVSW